MLGFHVVVFHVVMITLVRSSRCLIRWRALSIRQGRTWTRGVVFLFVDVRCRVDMNVRGLAESLFRR